MLENISDRHKLVVHSVLHDFFNGHVLKNMSEVKQSCLTLFSRRGLTKLLEDHLSFYITQASCDFFGRDPSALEERAYKERIRPRNAEEASKAHYTAAEKNFVQKILKILGEKTSVNLLKQESIDRVVSLYKELYPKIFGNESFRTDSAIEALIRREQKRLDYGFIKAHESLCPDDYQDMHRIQSNLRKLILRRIRSVEDEQPFLL